MSEKYQDWFHKQFISNSNNKLHGYPFKVIPLEFNALSHPFLPRYDAQLEVFFGDASQL